MKTLSEKLKPYTTITKSWLTNLSVAATAVGLFQDSIPGLWCGFGLFVGALLVAVLEEEIL